MKCIIGLAGALVLASVTALAGPPAGQRAVFKADVEAVNLAVSISDGQRYVIDLGQTDFQVYEDGIKQDLAVFSREHTPVSLAILMDVSLSMEPKLEQAREAAARFVRRLRPQDEAQIVHFNDRVRVAQGFTGDAQLLEQAIRSAQASGGTALYTAVYVALKDLARQRREGEVRRLAIVVLSDGEDTASLVSDEQALGLARKSEIGVYGISLRGAQSAAAERHESGLSRFFISALSRETGGEAHFPRAIAQLGTVYERVLEELRSQYSIGYVSNNPRRDGKWRNIVVRLLGRPQLRVRHKPGYFAPPS
ncbi:MAG TPA: VWA domain-containing protein [Vicinamibacteria bacterium]|nr:VWA domain-containing protein [Vicinamibacteria bacterium]